jgi:DNA-3-methyladenine glycosylase II
MPTTRSSTRSLASTASRITIENPATINKSKRKAPSEPSKHSTQKKSRQVPASTQAIPSAPESNGVETSVLPPALPKGFSFQEARRHLINADGRFEDIFDKLLCRPFENLEQNDPFKYYRLFLISLFKLIKGQYRALVESILYDESFVF